MQKESVRKGKFATPSAKPRPAVSLFTIPGASLGAHLLTAALLPLLVVCCCLAPELLTLGVAGEGMHENLQIQII
jgi:hypothetical protein